MSIVVTRPMCVRIDGVELRGVRAVHVRHEVGSISHATVELLITGSSFGPDGVIDLTTIEAALREPQTLTATPRGIRFPPDGE